MFHRNLHKFLIMTWLYTSFCLAYCTNICVSVVNSCKIWTRFSPRSQCTLHEMLCGMLWSAQSFKWKTVLACVYLDEHSIIWYPSERGIFSKAWQQVCWNASRATYFATKCEILCTCKFITEYLCSFQVSFLEFMIFSFTPFHGRIQKCIFLVT